MSIGSKANSYWIYQKIALLFIFLHQPSILWPLQLHVHQHYDNWGVWSDSKLFNGMRLVIIAIAIDLTSLVWSILKAIHFTHELYARVIDMAIKTWYCSQKSDFYKFDLSSRQFTLLINCTLGSIIYLSSNAVMITGPSSHKFRFICHFSITTLSRKNNLQ